MTKVHNLCIILIFIGFIKSVTYTNVTLTHSSKSSKVVFPTSPRQVEYVVYNYPSKIKQVPEASWIWAGFGNQADCPMTITIEDQVTVTCLMQPLTLYASADNKFTASFFGQSLSGNSWSAPVSRSIDPKGSVCNGTYTFTITAVNEVNANQVGCSGGNWGAVIYGVIQRQPDLCCSTTAEYYDPSTCECYPCQNLFDMGCTDCTLSSCTKCNTTANFIPDGTKCKCKSDQYVLNVTECIVCNKSLDNCINCNDQNTCIKCQVGYKLNPTAHKCQKCEIGCLSCDYDECFICDTSKQFQLSNLQCVCNDTSGLDLDECKLCSVMIENCTSCMNGTSCTNCDARSMLNNDSTACIDCPIGCSSCQHSTGCLTCDKGYYLSTNSTYIVCIGECGDGVLISAEGQKCDDGNIAEGDGCSSTCLIENDYICDNAQQNLSNCSYSGAFRLFVKWVKKQYYLNKLNISIGIRPHVEKLNLLNFLSSFQKDNSLIDNHYIYDSNGTIYLSYFYNRTLEGQNILFTFSPSNVSTIFQHTLPSSLLIEMTTNSNIPITYYDQSQEYQPSQTIQKLLSYSVFFSYFIIFGSLFVNKVASLELFFLQQVSFFSLGVVNKVNPVSSGIFWMRKVNGYNWIEPADNRYVPDRINSINYSRDIYQNLNLNFVILVAATIFTIVVKCLSMFMKSKSANQLRNVFFLSIVTGFFYFVLFIEINVGFSCGLQLLYGEFTNFNTIVFIFCIILSFLLLILFIFARSQQYQQFYSLFKQQFESQQYFTFNFLYRFSLGFILSLLNQSSYVPIYSLFLSISFLIYQFSVKPFRTSYQNYVSILNQFTIVLILSLRMFYRSMKNQYPFSVITKILEPGYIEVVLVLVNILFVLALLLYETIIKLKAKKRLMEFQEAKERRVRMNMRILTNETNQQNEIKDEHVHIYIL